MKQKKKQWIMTNFGLSKVLNMSCEMMETPGGYSLKCAVNQAKSQGICFGISLWVRCYCIVPQ